MTKIILLFVSIVFAACIQNQQQSNASSSAKATDSTNTSFKPANADEQEIYNRAFNAVIWGMPAVNSELMHESLLQAKGDYNQIVYWSGLVNDKNQTLTPNPDVIYINPFYDTRQGPVVLEIPPADGVSSISMVIPIITVRIITKLQALQGIRF